MDTRRRTTSRCRRERVADAESLPERAAPAAQREGPRWGRVPPPPATSATAVGLGRFPWLEAPSGEPWTPASGVTEPSPRGKPEIDFEPLGHTCSVSAGAWGICLSPGRNLRGRGWPGVQTHAGHQPRGHKPVWSMPGALLLLSFHFCLREEKGCRAAGAGVQKKPGGGV